MNVARAGTLRRLICGESTDEIPCLPLQKKAYRLVQSSPLFFVVMSLALVPLTVNIVKV